MDPKPTFEDLLNQLKELVHEMEGGQLTLDMTMEKYQAGAKILQICHRTLDEMEGRIEKLEREGRPPEPFESAGDAAPD